MTTNQMTNRLRLAANYIEEHGWTQGKEEADDGSACLTGAIRLCAPQTGDEYLIREVLRRRERAEQWNDQAGREAAEVVTYLRSAEITDDDLADTFGPQWKEIVALVRRAATLTEDEAGRLIAAGAAAWTAARSAARDAARSAAEATARSAAEATAWAAAWYAACAAAWTAACAAAGAAAWTAARDAAGDAAGALSVRDLIGQHGLTQEHYDTLTRPWASVIGKVHPDDEGMQ